MRKYRFFEDPGHGWMEVSIHELHELGIIDKISSYSYVSRDRFWAYLEEDCDLSVWAEAKGYPYPEKKEEWAEFWENNVEKIYHEDDRIRNLPYYALLLRRN